MFPPGTGVTHSLDVLRQVAWQEPLDTAWLEQARRVAGRCVVVRDVPGGDLLESLGAERVISTRRRVRYGVWSARSAR